MDSGAANMESSRMRKRKEGTKAAGRRREGAESDGADEQSPVSGGAGSGAEWEYDSDVVQTDDDVRQEMQRLVEMEDQFRAEGLHLQANWALQQVKQLQKRLPPNTVFDAEDSVRARISEIVPRTSHDFLLAMGAAVAMLAALACITYLAITGSL